MEENVDMSGKVAIIGAGPAGCYTAQALLKAAPDLEVDIIDAQPVPYGLVRYGVAADHQGTKGVTRQFERVFTRMNARFYGNVKVGHDVPLAALEEAYDTVVMAIGLSADRKLGIPGDDLPGVYGSARLTRALYDHPDAEPLPDLGPNPVIIGTGNVAVDLLRLLVKTPQELAGSDLGPGPTDWLKRLSVRQITTLGRSPAAAARFDPAMIRELSKLERINATLHPTAHGTEGIEGVLAELAKTTFGALPVDLLFERTPCAIRQGPDGLILTVSSPAGREEIAASSIITAIGFASDGLFAAGTYYAVGWHKTGPTGALPRCREDAQMLAAEILECLSPDPARTGRVLLDRLPNTTDFAHWQAIDTFEKAAAAPDRCRRKLADKTGLLTTPTLQDT